MSRLSLACAAVLFATPAFAAPVPINLGPWVANGGSWTLGAGNNSVTQTENSPTIAFHSDGNDIGTRITGTMAVETTEDDDFMGFVLGYQNNDILEITDPQTQSANTDISYILIDWKQSAQGTAGPGIRAAHVTGNIWAIGNNQSALLSDAWTHTGVVAPIPGAAAPSAIFDDTGWADNQVYSFVVDYTADRIQLQIDGTLELDLTPDMVNLTSFPEGAFGFYGYSQPNVRYAALEAQPSPLTPVPLPAPLALLGVGLGSLAFLRRRRA